MDTKLYKALYEELLNSGLSKRKFCEKYNIPHSWFIEFINPDKPFRPTQIKTIALLRNTFNIEEDVIMEYNSWVAEQRKVV